MSDPRTCDDCGETFPTITRCRLHDCPGDDDSGDRGEQDRPEPDWADPFSPDPDGSRELRCIHCGDTFPESEVVYERRHGSGPLWWCPNPECDGAGVGIDLHELSG